LGRIKAAFSGILSAGGSADGASMGVAAAVLRAIWRDLVSTDIRLTDNLVMPLVNLTGTPSRLASAGRSGGPTTATSCRVPRASTCSATPCRWGRPTRGQAQSIETRVELNVDGHRIADAVAFNIARRLTETQSGGLLMVFWRPNRHHSCLLASRIRFRAKNLSPEQLGQDGVSWRSCSPELPIAPRIARGNRSPRSRSA